MAQSVPAGAPAALSAKVSATVPLARVTTEALGLSRAARRASSSALSGPKLEYQRASSMRSR